MFKSMIEENRNPVIRLWRSATPLLRRRYLFQRQPGGQHTLHRYHITPRGFRWRHYAAARRGSMMPRGSRYSAQARLRQQNAQWCKRCPWRRIRAAGAAKRAAGASQHLYRHAVVRYAGNAPAGTDVLTPSGYALRHDYHPPIVQPCCHKPLSQIRRRLPLP